MSHLLSSILVSLIILAVAVFLIWHNQTRLSQQQDLFRNFEKKWRTIK
jgi:hypothetical protein